jgi:hypothetical protein
VTGRTLASLAAAIATITMIAAACGGSSDPPAHSTRSQSAANPGRTGTAATSTDVVSAGTGATTAPTRQASPTPIATAGQACRSADLAAVYLGQNGATGNVVLSFALRNRGTATCHTYGWPGVEFLGADGQALRTRSRRVTKDILGSTSASVITLEPGREASFRMIAPDEDARGGTAGCRTAHALQIIPPDDTTTISVQIPDGVYECTAATVSPLQPGGTARA